MQIVFANRECTCQKGTPYFLRAPQGLLLLCDECESAYLSPEDWERGRTRRLDDAAVRAQLPAGRPYAAHDEVRGSAWSAHIGIRFGMRQF